MAFQGLVKLADFSIMKKLDLLTSAAQNAQPPPPSLQSLNCMSLCSLLALLLLDEKKRKGEAKAKGLERDSTQREHKQMYASASFISHAFLRKEATLAGGKGEARRSSRR